MSLQGVFINLCPPCVPKVHCATAVYTHVTFTLAVSTRSVSPRNVPLLKSVSELCPITVSLQCVGNSGVCLIAYVLLCDFRAGRASSHWAQPYSVIKILFSLTTPFHGSFFTCAKNTQSALAQTRGEGGGEHKPLSERTCKCVDGQKLGTYDLT